MQYPAIFHFHSCNNIYILVGIHVHVQACTGTMVLLHLQLIVIAVNCYIGGYRGAKLLYLQYMYIGGYTGTMMPLHPQYWWIYISHTVFYIRPIISRGSLVSLLAHVRDNRSEQTKKCSLPLRTWAGRSGKMSRPPPVHQLGLCPIHVCTSLI